METFLRKNRNNESVPLLRERRWGLEQQLGDGGSTLVGGIGQDVRGFLTSGLGFPMD